MARILVVEDERDLRELLVEQLEDEGHTIVEAANGQLALDRLAEAKPDLILSDINMPVMDGYEFFQTLKENYPALSRTPFIYLTALAGREDELKGLRLGVDAYITKPIDYDLLFMRIETILRIYRLQKSLVEAGRKEVSSAFETGSSFDEEQPEVGEQPEPLATPSVDYPAAATDGKREDVTIGADGSYVISLEKLRQRFGPKWSSASDRVLRITEQILRSRLRAGDVHHIAPSRDVSIFFADMPPDQAAAKAKEIRREIWVYLFGEDEDDNPLPIEKRASQQSLKKPCEAAELPAQPSLSAACKRLERIYNYEDLHLTKLLGGSGAPSKILRLTFNKYFSDKIGEMFRENQFSADEKISFQKVYFANMGKKLKDIQKLARSGLVLPVSFPVIDEEKSRLHYAKHCNAFEYRLDGLLIIEVTETPDCFSDSLEALEPLPVGRRVQALELRKPEQIAGLEVTELQCSIISMSYENALRNAEDSQLRRFRQELRRQGIKFYIKDIPDGALIDAQKLRAELYSVQK